MKGNILKFALAASLILNVSLLDTAGYLYYKQSGYWTTPFGKKINKEFLFKELSLRPEQLKEMRSRAVPFRAEIDEKRNEITQKRKELISLMRMDNPDAKNINAVISEINGMQGEMQRKIAVYILKEKALLDKVQQKKFLDLIENAMHKGGK
jgi:Spy/CpxP family protein refolding chaperone